MDQFPREENVRFVFFRFGSVMVKKQMVFVVTTKPARTELIRSGKNDAEDGKKKYSPFQKTTELKKATNESESGLCSCVVLLLSTPFMVWKDGADRFGRPFSFFCVVLQ